MMLVQSGFRVAICVFCAAFFILASCARIPLANQQDAVRQVTAPDLADDLPPGPLLEAIRRQIDYLETDPARQPQGGFRFGSRYYPTEEYLAGLKRFIALAETPGVFDDSRRFRSVLEREFDFFEVYGQQEWGDVFITSYFEPLLQGTTQPTTSFSRPLYGRPDDLVTLDLAAFDTRFAQEKKLRGRVAGTALIPYYTREEIDSSLALQGRGLELCWVDPIEAYFLQVQGSGTVRVSDPHGNITEMRLNFADKNGHAYQSLGRFMDDLLPRESMTLQTMVAALRRLPPEELNRRLNKNPSYVFFKVAKQNAVTYLGLPATAGRTIATDQRYFPKGALALLSFNKPVYESSASKSPERSAPVTRFALDQDIGGAITGGGRVDLFWGQGDEAKRYAGVMKHRGRLIYLAPKRAEK